MTRTVFYQDPKIPELMEKINTTEHDGWSVRQIVVAPTGVFVVYEAVPDDG